MAEEQKTELATTSLTRDASGDSPEGAAKFMFSFRVAPAPEKGLKASAGKGIYEIDKVNIRSDAHCFCT